MATTEEEAAADILRGTTWRIYKFVVRAGRPVGIREVQRGLKLSSPTLASYHLTKLERAGFVKPEAGGYTADRLLLRNLIRFGKMLIPKYFFYLIFFASATAFQITVFEPPRLTASYLFQVAVLFSATGFFLYETLKTLLQKE
ncbi:MAG: helix-turn-helix domain-containing protein [Candidatus Bathyarchaeia archaeon]